MAAYGIGGLIAGKLAAKAGLFKTLLLVFAAKFWKLLIVAAAAIGVLIKKLLLGRRKEEPAPSIVEQATQNETPPGTNNSPSPRGVHECRAYAARRPFIFRFPDK